MTNQHPFNRIFNTNGVEAVRKKWLEEVKRQPNKALEAINHPELEFPSLFVLKDELNDHYHALSRRNRIGLLHIENVLTHTMKGLEDPCSPLEHYDDHLHCYKWIVTTGGAHLLNNDYNTVIDHACTHLYKFYNEGQLEELVNLIFHRYRNKTLSHYLLNILFDCSSPEWILLVARFFYSSPTDRKFARKLLHFIPGVNEAQNPEEAVNTVEAWYENNAHYLLFTGETHDTNHAPVPFVVHFPAKYIGKALHPLTGKFIAPVSQQDVDRRMSFSQLQIEYQELLATTSQQKRKENRAGWQQWIKKPLSTHLNEHNIRTSCCQ
ncbi:hypothetical protein JOD43_002500 [Pullulanibacillus pueri]|uniref:Uncharacterized protein n=1 Tax=Pullulanibacillus pueri TaxID=1437324 RepID=A0A8J2ZWA1_9BACL|nr:hypothetical protein [Pullulanibacillus pueri]MBM7682325.1 hypothetical protein [Pullulanibacillus pueri]GGH80790.1 hypothetical protein GCM10007096_17720 [Pullulanibacillus pueri]